MITIRSLFPGFNNGQGVAYTCSEICDHLREPAVKVEAWFPASDRAAHLSFTRDACPRLLLPLVYRLPEPARRLACAAEKRFLRALRPGDVAYLWPGVSIQTQERIKDRGITIVSERINCHTGFAKRTLDAEYARIGWPVSHELTDEDVTTENREMALADFIFAPNRFVVQSLREAGVPRRKILPVSYGWSPQRVAGNSRAISSAGGIDVLFVGRLCIRKGIHLLLEAWDKAKINGRLLLAGAVHYDLTERLGAVLHRPDIVELGHRTDIGSVYRSADVFAFNSLEEGGPMVTPEAMGCGLPVIVSPMGMGAGRDGIEGFVVDPHDTDGWVTALQRMAADTELRREMGARARQRADGFTWKQVAERRRELLLNALQRRMRLEVTEDEEISADGLMGEGSLYESTNSGT